MSNEHQKIDWPPNDPDVLAALELAFANGSWGRYHGPNCDALRAALAAMHNVEHVWLCASGTIAVELALRGLRVAGGDEVILAGYDFPGNFRAIEAVGALPVLVDIVSDTWCLDVELVAQAISERTRCVLVSHLHGGVADMRRLREVVADHDITIIEDACQNPGAIVQGRPAGTWGDVGVMSFGGSKLLTAGRGGALVTAQADVHHRVKIYTERGNDAFPLSELQAAVLVPQLKKLPERNAARLAAAEQLHARLCNLGASPVRVNYPDSTPSFYKFALMSDEPLPIDSLTAKGFHGFTKRTKRCRVASDLVNCEQAAAKTQLLPHQALWAACSALK